MDPKQIKLTPTQKIAPLLKAINQEIPYQLVGVFTLSFLGLFFGGAAIPVGLVSIPFWDFMLRRIIIGFAIGFVTFCITGVIWMTIEEKILPLIRKIREHYDKESLIVKKKLLEDIIEDEILHK